MPGGQIFSNNVVTRKKNKNTMVLFLELNRKTYRLILVIIAAQQSTTSLKKKLLLSSS
jgi:hypothetical protein